MRIVHVNLSDRSGGAAIACQRLHEQLIRFGVDSQLLVYVKVGEGDSRVHEIATGGEYQIRRVQAKLSNYLSRLQRDPSSFHCSTNLFSNNLLQRIESLKPDLVHLHWVGSNILQISDLGRIKYPMVWTHHDMWPFCGSEHYSYSQRWLDGYSASNRGEDASGLDLDCWTWERKKSAWAGVSINHVGPSRWMKECAASSALWKDSEGSRFSVISNGLDMDVFRPHECQDARDDFGISGELPVLLFGAHSVESSIKGGDLLKKVTEELSACSMQFQIVTFGRGQFDAPIGVPCLNVGVVNDCESLAKLYSCADVMLVPSRLEAFGQTASEAMSCGVPVCAFDTSGLRDIVDHQENGYLAKCFDIADFANGVGWCLDNLPKGAAAFVREKPLAVFKVDRCAGQYHSLYEQILKKNGISR
jgi:glycosyltransferase involved in cell wall biosynthesis